MKKVRRVRNEEFGNKEKDGGEIELVRRGNGKIDGKSRREEGKDDK